MLTAEISRHDAVFLDPARVGSSLRYIISASAHTSKNGAAHDREFNCDLKLTDCHETISWSAYGSKGPEHMREKLLAAIDFMQGMLAALDEVEAAYVTYPVSRDDTEE
jgi:hypothetical protein